MSIGLPGPTMVSHQPGLPVTGWTLATCWSPVSAWQTRTALRALGVERAVGLVGDLERRERDAGIELERLVGAEAHDQRMRVVRLAHAVGAIARAREASTSAIPVVVSAPVRTMSALEAMA